MLRSKLFVTALAGLALAAAGSIGGGAEAASARSERAQGAGQGTLEYAVLREINYARTHPFEYAQELRRLVDFCARGGRCADAVEADPPATEEAIAFLERQRPLSPLMSDANLAGSARDQVVGQGPYGGIGHDGRAGGFAERTQRHGVFAGLMAENISYGYDRAEEVVRQLIIDVGVQGRGHRENIFDPQLSHAGVSCGPHAAQGAMCVIDFSGLIARR